MATLCDICDRRLWRFGDPICEAYPKGIPEEISVNGFNHRKPFPGDNGLRYVKGPGKEQK